MTDQESGRRAKRIIAARVLLPLGFFVSLYGFISPILLDAPESDAVVFVGIGLILAVISMGVQDAWVKG